MSAPLIYLMFYSLNTTYEPYTAWTTSNVAMYIDALTNVGNSSYMAGFLSATGLTKPSYATYNIVYKTNLAWQSDLLTTVRHQQALQSSFAVFSGTNNQLWPSFWNGRTLALLFTSPQTSNGNLAISPSIYYDSKMGGFCGYHSFFTSDVAYGSRKLYYGVIGTGSALGNCAFWANNPGYLMPNGNTPQYVNSWPDAAVSVAFHELFEIMSNPEGTAWYDNGTPQLEWMDKCGGFPSGINFVSGTTGTVYNAIINNRKYLLQQVFDKVSNTCPPLVYS
jgi:hypothetical protein